LGTGIRARNLLVGLERVGDAPRTGEERHGEFKKLRWERAI
jgi:hypothetical protein